MCIMKPKYPIKTPIISDLAIITLTINAQRRQNDNRHALQTF